MISIGDIDFNTDIADGDGTKWYARVEGWDQIDQRVLTAERPTDHGEITLSNLYAARGLTVFGTAYADDQAGFWAAKNTLVTETNVLTHFDDDELLVVVSEEVDKQRSVVRTSLFTNCIDGRVLSFEMTLRADDPFKYAVTASTLTTSGTANNAGTVITYPTFTLTSSGAPTLTAGAATWSAVASLPSGTVIDMKRMTVLNGVTNLYADVDPSSTWFGFEPGNTSVSSTVAGTWSWRSAWL